jgi:hypothetical protein
MCVCVCMYVYIYVCTYTHTYVRTYVRTYTGASHAKSNRRTVNAESPPRIPGPSNSLRAAATGTATVPKVTVMVTVAAKVTVVANVTPTAMVIYG